MIWEIDNHMLDKEDRPTIIELSWALDLVMEKQRCIYNVLPNIENMINDSNRLSLSKEKLGDFFTYLSAELDDCETERKTLLGEIGQI